MKCSVLIVLALAASVVSAVPSVDPQTVSFAQPTAGKAEISYVLSGESAVITVDVQTNAGAGVWVSLGALRSLSGDVNRVIRPSDEPRRIVWNCHKDLPPFLVSGANTRAVVEVWPLTAPPDYAVVDLIVPSVSYYRDAAAVPGGVGADVYKTSSLLLRRIRAAGVYWQMGTPKSVIDQARPPTTTVSAWNSQLSDLGKEVPHPVMLSKDYYIGVYPLTQGQYSVLRAKIPSLPAVSSDYMKPVGPKYPQTGLTYKACRQGTANPSAINWPTTGDKLADDCLLKRLTDYVGNGLHFDLPTEAQWEYACRAGEEGNWNAEYPGCVWTQATGMHEVGYSGNAFGVFDMHGNVGEWCRDWFYTDYIVDADDTPSGTDQSIDPVGVQTAEDADVRCVRGGYWVLPAATTPVYARCGARYHGRYDTPNEYFGVRLVAPAKIDLPNAE